MSGGCQVDNLPSPLSVPFVLLVLFAPFRQPRQPTDLFPNLYIPACARMCIYYIKRLVGKSVIGLACDVECVITYKIIKFILQGCVFHILSVSLHRKSVR